MSEMEKRIMETIAKAVKWAPEQKKDYLLGWDEGAASMVCEPQTAQRPSA